MKLTAIISVSSALIITSLCGEFAAAQETVVVSKEEFVQSQLALMEQMKQAQADEEAGQVSDLQQQLSPEAYAEYQEELTARQTAQDKQVADCLGLPVAEIVGLSQKVGPDFQISLIKSCSAKLPDELNLSQLQLEGNADLEAYRQCAESMVASEIGVTSEKLRQCSRLAN